MRGQCPSCGGDCGHTKAKGCQYGRDPAARNDWADLNLLTVPELRTGIVLQRHQIDLLRSDVKNLDALQKEQFADLLKLTAERDSLALDAKRYRWLRSIGAGVWPRLGTRCRVVAEGDSLDEYVDMGIEGKSV